MSTSVKVTGDAFVPTITLLLTTEPPIHRQHASLSKG
ncbi:hypothetical protein SAMN00120144_1737 [Hymenobacter roseosalivarius DSM 11622]|uniref:Uncharacterized protein n=1 Tax=Hymenobacter roseosalivarius DSM 11622 TaxID=645990 RepID=A0A1W1VZA1_9BACT|nr:hypothetical protein SAMN00120144_1737 [Hymenobacter roseosalivarius DSM 11622]